jgi:acyl-CoA thioesterase
MGRGFADLTEVRPAGDGRYRGTIDPSWNLRPMPQGGVVTALALRAMAAELDEPGQRLRTLHTTFAGQVADGDVEIDVEVLRHGRSVSQLRAEVRNPGTSRGHLTTGIYGASRRGFDFTDLEPPADVSPPSEYPSFRDPPPPEAGDFEEMPFWAERVEGRAVFGHAPWEEYVPERAVRTFWYRLEDPAELDDGTLDPLGLVVLADTMPGAVGEMVGDQPHNWFAPSIDLTFHLLDDWRSPWVLVHNTARHAGDGYSSADNALWDCGPEGLDEPRLIAYATQMFLFTFPADS